MDNFAQNQLSKAAANIILNIGFKSASQNSLDILTKLMENSLTNLASTASASSQFLCNKSEPDVNDICFALKYKGINLNDLINYTALSNDQQQDSDTTTKSTVHFSPNSPKSNNFIKNSKLQLPLQSTPTPAPRKRFLSNETLKEEIYDWMPPIQPILQQIYKNDKSHPVHNLINDFSKQSASSDSGTDNLENLKVDQSPIKAPESNLLSEIKTKNWTRPKNYKLKNISKFEETNLSRLQLVESIYMNNDSDSTEEEFDYKSDYTDSEEEIKPMSRISQLLANSNAQHQKPKINYKPTMLSNFKPILNKPQIDRPIVSDNVTNNNGQKYSPIKSVKIKQNYNLKDVKSEIKPPLPVDKVNITMKNLQPETSSAFEKPKQNVDSTPIKNELPNIDMSILPEPDNTDQSDIFDKNDFYSNVINNVVKKTDIYVKQREDSLKNLTKINNEKEKVLQNKKCALKPEINSSASEKNAKTALNVTVDKNNPTKQKSTNQVQKDFLTNNNVQLNKSFKPNKPFLEQQQLKPQPNLNFQQNYLSSNQISQHLNIPQQVNQIPQQVQQIQQIVGQVSVSNPLQVNNQIVLSNNANSIDMQRGNHIGQNDQVSQSSMLTLQNIQKMNFANELQAALSSNINPINSLQISNTKNQQNQQINVPREKIAMVMNKSTDVEKQNKSDIEEKSIMQLAVSLIDDKNLDKDLIPLLGEKKVKKAKKSKKKKKKKDKDKEKSKEKKKDKNLDNSGQISDKLLEEIRHLTSETEPTETTGKNDTVFDLKFLENITKQFSTDNSSTKVDKEPTLDQNKSIEEGLKILNSTQILPSDDELDSILNESQSKKVKKKKKKKKKSKDKDKSSRTETPNNEILEKLKVDNKIEKESNNSPILSKDDSKPKKISRKLLNSTLRKDKLNNSSNTNKNSKHSRSNTPNDDSDFKVSKSSKIKNKQEWEEKQILQQEKFEKLKLEKEQKIKEQEREKIEAEKKKKLEDEKKKVEEEKKVLEEKKRIEEKMKAEEKKKIEEDKKKAEAEIKIRVEKKRIDNNKSKSKPLQKSSAKRKLEQDKADNTSKRPRVEKINQSRKTTPIYKSDSEQDIDYQTPRKRKEKSKPIDRSKMTKIEKQKIENVKLSPNVKIKEKSRDKISNSINLDKNKEQSSKLSKQQLLSKTIKKSEKIDRDRKVKKEDKKSKSKSDKKQKYDKKLLSKRDNVIKPSFQPLNTDAVKEDIKVWLCPTCGQGETGDQWICCDKCDEWYHWYCMNIVEAPNENEQWFCLSCQNLKVEKIENSGENGKKRKDNKSKSSKHEKHKSGSKKRKR